MNRLLKILILVLASFMVAGSNGCPFDVDEILRGGSDGESASLTWKRAQHVIGQSSMTVVESDRSTDANTLLDPGGVIVSGGRLYIADSGANRVLGWGSPPDRNNEAADFVLGQPGMSDDGRGRDRAGLHEPVGLIAGSWGLAVADLANHRVLLWNERPTSGPQDADRVFGQPTRDEVLLPGCDADAMDSPWGVAAPGSRLLVSDYENNRLLLFERGDASGADARGVIGQPDLSTCVANRGQGQASADSLSGPAGIWTDGDRLAVADRFNNRVLLWDSFPEEGEPADRVIGQEDMDSNTTNAGGLERGLNAPTAVWWDGSRLFVADRGNHRVLIYDRWPSRNHVQADAVLGQPDRRSNQRNNTGDNSPVNARSLSRPEAVYSDGEELLVVDSDNDRVLSFDISD
ncbi:hypothetical protein VCB98_08625 [Gammaproteobacteria bacterium AB-CW1]|uniref:NHL repeat containing protein n=1 Tax=Natronospira elongata TaxID=3110268 RepID=A0AAP6JFV8_9GAMM|nr:hypothetical protein [Gammaproteobacteria bacterium AB-CW1]